MADLLISGGARDPSISHLTRVAEARGLDVVRLCFDETAEPAFVWDLDAGLATVGGKPVTARGAFLRYDVFSYDAAASAGRLDHAGAWHSAVTSWCLAQPGLRMLNRNLSQHTAHKAYVLRAAAALGIATPRTLLSNDENAVRKFGPPSDTVVKPAAGGAYSQTLDTLLDTAPWRGGTAPIPAFIQPKLIYPEYRVYRIGPTFITLKIGSRQLDYRADRNASIAHVENGTIGAGLIERLTALSDGLGVDFAAFDLKTNAATSAVCLLELNTSPMIPAFDPACGGAIARAIVDYLLDSNGKPRPYPTARKAK